MNCFMLRRDSKPAAMYEFERASAKGEYREGGPGRNFRQEIYAGRISRKEMLKRHELLDGVPNGLPKKSDSGLEF